MYSIIAFFGAVLLHAWNIFTDGLLGLFDIKSKHAFNAQFGRETIIGSRWNKGLYFSRHRRLTRKQSYQNLLLSGPTGAGKTVRYLMKMVLSSENQIVIINDPAKEIYRASSGFLSKKFRILTLNFSNAAESCGINFLHYIKKSSDIDRIAHMLVAGTLDRGANSDQYWIIQAKTIMVIGIRLILYRPKEEQHLASVLRFIDMMAAEPQTVDKWIVETKDEQLILRYKALVATPDKTLANCLSSARSALAMFEIEDFAKVTSVNTIDLANLRKTPTILYLHDSISEKKFVEVLNGLFFEILFGQLLQELPKKDDLDVMIILEECSSLRIELLPTFLANNRKYLISNVICVQQPTQLETLYPKDYRNIYENCTTKIFLPGLTATKTLQELEQLGGKTTFTNTKGTETVKPLVTVDWLRQLPDNRALVIHGNLPFVLARTSPYYWSWFTFLRYSKIPPVPLKGNIPEGNISYIS